MQLEHNFHEQPGNMPILQAEHWSEHSEAFQDFTNSDSLNVRAHKSPERTQLRHSGHRSSGIGHTGNPLGIGDTGTCSDHEHRSTEPDITLMSLVLYGEIVTHIVIIFSSNTLTQVNSLQLR